MLYFQFFISGSSAPVFVFGPLHFVGGGVYQAGSVDGGVFVAGGTAWVYSPGSVAAEVHYGY